jgi:hypothetical protein
MKLLTMTVSAAAILSGFLCHYSPLIIAGAVVYLACLIAELFLHYRDMKLLRTGGTPQPDSNSAISVRVARWIQNTIALTGLVLVVATKGEGSDYAIAGWIIWIGVIVCYFISGIIAREVGGVPLSMGYGGWRVRRDRKGRLRR